MKKFITILFFSILFCNPGNSFVKGKGEVKMTEKALDHFVNYVWGNFDVDLTKVQAWSSRANNPKPLMFIMSSNGDWTTAWFCPYSRCSDPDSKQTIKECERETGTTCGVFALRKRIYWDNGINTKTNKAKVNKNMDYDRIKSLLISLDFYDENTSSSSSSSSSSESLTEDLKDLKKLYDDGVLTKKEYEKAKKKLLN